MTPQRSGDIQDRSICVGKGRHTIKTYLVDFYQKKKFPLQFPLKVIISTDLYKGLWL